MKRIKSTRAWSCKDGICRLGTRSNACDKNPCPDCRPVRVYPEAQARLMERAVRILLDEDIPFIKAWAKLEGRT